jgi:hypothetical protein
VNRNRILETWSNANDKRNSKLIRVRLGSDQNRPCLLSPAHLRLYSYHSENLRSRSHWGSSAIPSSFAPWSDRLTVDHFSAPQRLPACITTHFIPAMALKSRKMKKQTLNEVSVNETIQPPTSHTILNLRETYYQPFGGEMTLDARYEILRLSCGH